MDRFRSAAQNRRIPALDAEPGGIDGNVGSCLVNNTDHAQRYPHLADLYTARAVFHIRDFSNGVGQCGNLLQSLGHGGDRFFG